MNMQLIGLLLWVGILVVAAIPIIVFAVFAKYSKIVADRNYLESANVDLEMRLSWHKRRVEELKSNPPIFLEQPRSAVNQQTLVHHPDAQMYQDVRFDPLELPDNPNAIQTEPPSIEDKGSEQLEMEFDRDVAETSQFSPPKISQMPEAGIPDPTFLKRLQASRPDLSNVVLFPPPSTAVGTDKWQPFTLLDEEVDSMEQAVMELEIEEKREYEWTKGYHFLHFRIIDPHGHDLALCEIIGNGGTTMLQHAKIAELDHGDQFVASIFIHKGGGRNVQQIWTVPQQNDLTCKAEG